MNSAFQYMTDYIFRYRIFLLVIVVITLHAQVYFYFSERIKIQGHDLDPQKVISAVLTLKSRTNSLPSVNPKYDDLISKSEDSLQRIGSNTRDSNKWDSNKRDTNKRGTNKRGTNKSSDTSHSENLSKNRDSIKNAVLAEIPEATTEGHRENLSDLKGPTHEPIHITNPLFKHTRPIPAYPQQALRKREEGVVIIRVLISKSGQVTQAIVQQSSGSVWLDAAAKQAAQKAEFYPHIVAGVAHQTRADLPFRFVLK